MGEIIMDQRGRIVIPKDIREALRLRSDQKLTIEARAGAIILKPKVDVNEFIAQFKGCVSGSRIKPSEIKEIWGVEHAHH